METAADDIEFDISTPRDEKQESFNSLALLADLPRSDVPTIVISDASVANDSSSFPVVEGVVKDNNENSDINDNYNDETDDIAVELVPKIETSTDVDLENHPTEHVEEETVQCIENSEEKNESITTKTEDNIDCNHSLQFSDVIGKETGNCSQNEFTSLKEINTETATQDELELEEEAINLETILMKEKQESDSDSEFDFDLPTAASASTSESKDTVSKPAEIDTTNKEERFEATKDEPKVETPLAEAAQTSTPKPLAFIKPTPQALGFSYEVETKEKVLEAAQDEWEKVATIQPGYKDSGTQGGSEPPVVQTMPSISPHELKETLLQGNFDSVRANIKPAVERRGFAAFVNLLFGPPKLTRNLLEERDKVFCIAASQLDNGNSSHVRTLQTIYRCLTGSKFDCARVGNHWEEIGFQGTDPATDLRGSGILGLLNLLYFLRDPKKQTLASDIYRLSLHPTQNFPFCVMGINLTKITLQTLREEMLNKECNRRGEILSVVNEFYVGLYLQLYLVWKGQGKTISDSGYVIKDLELKAKKNPKWVLKSLEDYLTRKPTIVTEKSQGPLGGDEFVNVCD